MVRSTSSTLGFGRTYWLLLIVTMWLATALNSMARGQTAGRSTPNEPNAANEPNQRYQPNAPSRVNEPQERLEPTPDPLERFYRPASDERPDSRQRAGRANAQSTMPGPRSSAEEELQGALEQFRKQAAELIAQRAELARTMAELRAQLEGLKSENQALPNADSLLQVIKLRYADAQEAARLTGRITLSRSLNVAVDHRNNQLILRGTKEDVEAVQQIIESIDRRDEHRPQASTATLRLRLLWLADGLPNTKSTPLARTTNLPPQVLDAVARLGLSEPIVLCNYVATVAKKRDESAEFHFTVPVIVNESVVPFSGSGAIEGDIFHVRLQTSAGGSEASGAFQLPLKRYLVVGTTNIVTQDDSPTSYPVALVVYLDAPEYVGDEQNEQREGNGNPGPTDRGRSQNPERKEV
jgi:Bacterial type II/III secretion system short domain